MAKKVSKINKDLIEVETTTVRIVQKDRSQIEEELIDARSHVEHWKQVIADLKSELLVMDS